MKGIQLINIQMDKQDEYDYNNKDKIIISISPHILHDLIDFCKDEALYTRDYQQQGYFRELADILKKIHQKWRDKRLSEAIKNDKKLLDKLKVTGMPNSQNVKKSEKEEGKMKVYLQLIGTAEPIIYYHALNLWIANDTLCIAYLSTKNNQEKWTDKYPLDHVFRVSQEYGYSQEQIRGTND